MANKYDKDVVESFASQTIEVPTLTDDYLNSNEYTVKWIEQNWNEYFSNNKPDAILIGGWPFFSTIKFFKKIGIKTIFMDCGTVPLEGFSGGAKVIQEKLRSLRKQFLPETSLVIGISEFIVSSQSKIDVANKVPTKTILLGADHMEMTLWDSTNLHLSKSSKYVTNLLTPLKLEDKKIILNLGRWEPNCYKNSEASFDVMRQIMKFFPNCVLLVLANPRDVEIPKDLQKSIIPIGFPDDKDLQKIMEEADIGISLSLWEGFNLPIAEMQNLGRPVLAFNVGAHPEVIVHPWYLCKNNKEMADKACDILSGKGLDASIKKESLEKFRNYFKWERVIQEYKAVLEELISENNKHLQEKISLIIDVTNAAKDPANSGVIRVTRRISREFQNYLDPIFVIWNSQDNCYVFPTKKEFQILGQFNGPLLSDKNRVSPDDDRIALGDYLVHIDDNSIKWLLFTETLDESYGRVVRRYARDHGINLAAIFYDAIPVLSPEFCKDEAIKNNHANYMTGLAECDIAIPISNFSSLCLDNFWKDHNIKGSHLSPNLLPGEFGGFARKQIIQEPISNKVNILCVSTLEPRKNHIKLIDACLQMQEKYPELDWTLTLVGNRYAGAFEISDYVQRVSERNSRIKWLGVVDDAMLHQLYDEATFTVYPSIIEGFGMPILESIWHGKPCICYQKGVMSEIAAEGGCLTTDVLDENKFSYDIYRLATDKELLLKLSNEAIVRKIKTWDEYTRSFISILQSPNPIMRAPISQNQNTSLCNNRNWEDILYPDCLCKNWQMNHSERLALTAILSHLKPLCSIEVGTYKGGSLSLISQHSKMVFSLDIDPSIPDQFSYFKNVSFLIAPSATTLPVLLKELDAENIPVEFILINGDHSAEGIKHDLDYLLSYIPKKPLFVAIHDSFNPECRQGIFEANWSKSPYVHWVDIDFVPGRLVEDEGMAHGKMWGGLALAYFKPEIRSCELVINQTAKEMYERIRQSLVKGLLYEKEDNNLL
jgi:glycosyltransferase involved in cell wall biosynthesis